MIAMSVLNWGMHLQKQRGMAMLAELHEDAEVEAPTVGSPMCATKDLKRSLDAIVESKGDGTIGPSTSPPASDRLVNLLERAKLAYEVQDDRDVDELARHHVTAIARPEAPGPWGKPVRP